MATPEEENLAQFKEVYGTLTDGIEGTKKRGTVFQMLLDIRDYGKAIWEDVNKNLPERILTHKVTWYGFDGKTQPAGKRNTVTLAAVIGWLDSGISQLINGQAAILAAVKASSEKQGIDPAELERLITEAVAKSAGTYELRKVED